MQILEYRLCLTINNNSDCKPNSAIMHLVNLNLYQQKRKIYEGKAQLCINNLQSIHHFCYSNAWWLCWKSDDCFLRYLPLKSKLLHRLAAALIGGMYKLSKWKLFSVIFFYLPTSTFERNRLISTLKCNYRMYKHLSENLTPGANICLSGMNVLF